MTNSVWPLFDLAIRTPVMTLQYVDDALGMELAELAGRGVHDPATMPFLTPWTDAPQPELQTNTMRYYWEQRAATAPDRFHLVFAAIVDGTVVGTSSVETVDFGVLGTFVTGSWLGLAFQGRGFGKEMRRASLAFGFDGLRARTAQTAAWHDNAASLAVTRSLGYTEEGRRITKRRDARDEIVGYRMERAAFDRIDTADIDVVGVDAARRFLEID